MGILIKSLVNATLLWQLEEQENFECLSSSLICCDVLLVPSGEITEYVSWSWYEKNADVSEYDESVVVPEDNAGADISKDDDSAVVSEDEQSWDKWKCDDSSE